MLVVVQQLVVVQHTQRVAPTWLLAVFLLVIRQLQPATRPCLLSSVRARVAFLLLQRTQAVARLLGGAFW
jgi:hypothetical protein